MAISFPSASSHKAFDRHIKRLVWCALLGSIALLIPVARASSSIDASLTEALGAAIVVIAVLTVVRDVTRYVRYEAARRREAASTSLQAGACRAADAIQDRVANLLSVTVGYVDFLAEDDRLPVEAREHAERALDSALAAARVVSAFRQSLGCEVRPPLVRSAELAVLEPSPGRSALANTLNQGTAWHYDADTRTIRSDNGGVVASVRPLGDRPAETRAGRVIAEVPALWNALGAAQQLAIALLAGVPRGQAEEARIRKVLDQINDVTQRLES
jgi:hypothetical protein